MNSLLPVLGTTILASLLACTWFLLGFELRTVSFETGEPTREIPTREESIPSTQDEPTANINWVVLLERPLFEPTRRVSSNEPVVEFVPEAETEAEAPEEDSTSPPPALSLFGTVTSVGSKSALVAIGSDRPVWVGIGDNVMGWEIDIIETQFIELSLDEQRLRVEIFE